MLNSSTFLTPCHGEHTLAVSLTLPKPRVCVCVCLHVSLERVLLRAGNPTR